MNRITLSLTAMLLCFLSCNKIPEEVQQTLDLAGANKHELQAVLDHYKAPKDSLKLKAAYFLLTYEVPYNFYYNSNTPKINQFFNTLNDSLQPYFGKENKWNAKKRRQLVKAIANKYQLRDGRAFSGRLEVKHDIDTITASFLIENIDYAFKAWSLPWAKQYSFEAFCKYILPYRSGNENLNHWRKYFFDAFKPFRDSVIGNQSNPLEAARLLREHLNKKRFVASGLKFAPEILSSVRAYKYCLYGNCVAISMLRQEIMRSQGIAISEVWFNKFGNTANDHISNTILDHHGVWHGYNKRFKDSRQDTDIDAFIGEENEAVYADMVAQRNKKATKIYRKDIIDLKKLSPEALTAQQTLGVIGWNDITAQVRDTYTITPKLGANDSVLKTKKIAYLCIFDNKNPNTWVPIDWALLDKNKTQVTFNDIAGKEVVYLVMVADTNAVLTPISAPFILSQNGTLNYLAAGKDVQHLTINRKHPPKKHLVKMAKTLQGGYFEASNTKNFTPSKKLFTLDSVNHADVITATIPSKPFQYYRFVLPNTKKRKQYHIAELAFGTFTNNVFHKIEGTPMASAQIEPKLFETLFDANLLTYASIKQNNKLPAQTKKLWIGVDFGKKQKISELYLCPRTDKNAIYPNMDYELLYWDTNWVSCGIKQSNNGILTYNNIPSGTLYWLRNLTEGREERIFTYQNNKQVWW